MQRQDEVEAFDDDSQESARREPIARSKESYSRTPRPKRRGTTASFNGLHRRRKKRIKW
jgi:hypothetical protein